MTQKSLQDRRHFMKRFTMVLGTTALGIPLLNLSSCQSAGNENDTTATADQGEASAKEAKKLGIALVGLGKYSKEQLAPALQETKDCYLAGIVTGTPSKVKEWQDEYSIPDKNVYNYETFDQLKDNPAIDVVYIVLPNSMHAEYSIRAAKAGKHVICEKPMAITAADCQRMIEACKENNVTLSIGYRLYFEPYNKRVMELGQQEVFGKVKSMKADNSQDMTKESPDVWRLDKKLSGGGPLMDVGIYCVQGICYTMGKNPVAVTAQFGKVTNPAYFKNVEESISWQLEFPGGVMANCTSSYSTEANLLSGEAENGWWRVSPAYAYDGKDGETSEGKMDYPQVFEQALQMDGICQSIKQNKPSIVPGEMGLRDVKIMEAIYEAARTGKKIPLQLS
ncbi:Gfo/Idh/MocA family oxidoreductase [Pontibacter qinzhouensis]|uniref:Gfo/Idh/MocA family oxidoreductase n=1 Tax=Pontibacter qinzhouensis TaxID=2603253 RepID=A0A5C8KDB6_9BACT|nr:Gfo/Idh/MocA family oxidoreductase [Pontibacter qinzhouensis]TXK52418.1 Gfo/Idh/MocA family oxidoreductase [Pontibacter qinzhouensis]